MKMNIHILQSLNRILFLLNYFTEHQNEEAQNVQPRGRKNKKFNQEGYLQDGNSGNRKVQPKERGAKAAAKALKVTFAWNAQNTVFAKQHI